MRTCERSEGLARTGGAWLCGFPDRRSRRVGRRGRSLMHGNVSWWGTVRGAAGFHDWVPAQQSGSSAAANSGRWGLIERPRSGDGVVGPEKGCFKTWCRKHDESSRRRDTGADRWWSVFLELSQVCVQIEDWVMLFFFQKLFFLKTERCCGGRCGI